MNRQCATATGVADRGNRRIVEVGHIVQAWRELFIEPEHVALAAEIHAGAERATRSGHDDGADRVVVVDGAK
jgi:hypothetical protein